MNAWYDTRGAENADKCAWTFGHSQFQTPNGAWANMTFGGRSELTGLNNLTNGLSSDPAVRDEALERARKRGFKGA